jgi:hypothetical protein
LLWTSRSARWTPSWPNCSRLKERVASSASNSNAKSCGSLKVKSPYSIIEIR